MIEKNETGVASKDGRKYVAKPYGKPQKLKPAPKKPAGLLLLSICGNERCTKEYLRASLEFGLNHYDKLFVLIADDPQSQNYRGATLPETTETNAIPKTQAEKEADLIEAARQQDEAELIAKARQQGDRYLEDNLHYLLSPIRKKYWSATGDWFKSNHPDSAEWTHELNELAKAKGVPITYYRWADLKRFDLPNKETIHKLYQDNATLREALEESVRARVKIALKQNPTKEDEGLAFLTDPEKQAALLAIRTENYYLFEVFPIYIIVAILLISDIIYAGKKPAVFDVTCPFAIRPIDDESAHPLAVKLSKPENVGHWFRLDFDKKSSASTLSIFAPVKVDHKPERKEAPSPDSMLAAVPLQRAQSCGPDLEYMPKTVRVTLDMRDVDPKETQFILSQLNWLKGIVSSSKHKKDSENSSTTSVETMTPRVEEDKSTPSAAGAKF